MLSVLSSIFLKLAQQIKLYHWSSHFQESNTGDIITLKPGRQNAEGIGVYFSLGVPVQRSTAEGSRNIEKPTLIEMIPRDNSKYWKSKGIKERKFNKPQTWHSEGRNVNIKIESREEFPDHILVKGHEV